jgi:CheY-like chemotaxis protein
VEIGVGGRLRILVVEGEPIAREILADLLNMAGYDVLSSHTGEQALLTLRQERGRIDCLFTAVDLPGLVDGWMLADEFRTTEAAAPVVFAAASKPAKARRPQGTAFVGYPVLPPRAVEAVKKLTRSEAVLRSRRGPPRVVAESTAPARVETLPPADLPGDLRKAAG